MTTHVVQGYSLGLGWCDCITCESAAEAQQREKELLLKDSAWMRDTPKEDRRTRIVQAAEARCAPYQNPFPL